MQINAISKTTILELYYKIANRKQNSFAALN